MTRADREQRADMLAVLGSLECLSYGTTTAWDSSGAANDDTDGRPRGGDTRPLHDVFAARFNQADTFTKRETVLTAATEALQAERVSRGDRAITETPEQLTARIRDLRHQGWTIKDVSRACRCTETRVRQADKDSTTAKVIELRGRCTERQIATITGLSQATVHRILKAA